MVEEQKAWLNAADARIAELKCCRDEGRASTATYRKELLQAQKNLAATPGKVKAILARTVAITKGRDSVTTKFEELTSSMEQRVGFANEEMACLEAEVVRVTQEWDKSIEKEEPMSLEFSAIED